MLKKSQIRELVDDVLLELADKSLNDDEITDIATEIAQRLADISDDVYDDDEDEVLVIVDEESEDD